MPSVQIMAYSWNFPAGHQTSVITRPGVAIRKKTRRFGNYSSKNLWKSMVILCLNPESSTLIYSKNTNKNLRNSLKMAECYWLFASWSSNSTSIHQLFDSSTIQLRYQRFETHLNHEPRVGTPTLYHSNTGIITVIEKVKLSKRTKSYVGQIWIFLFQMLKFIHRHIIIWGGTKSTHS